MTADRAALREATERWRSEIAQLPIEFSPTEAMNEQLKRANAMAVGPASRFTEKLDQMLARHEAEILRRATSDSPQVEFANNGEETETYAHQC